MKRVMILSITIAVAFVAFGCAATQEIHVRSEPSGARIFMDGNYVASTPASIDVKKNKDSTTLQLESNGYNPFIITYHRELSVWRIARTFAGAVLVGASQLIQNGGTKGSVIAASTGFLVAGGCGFVYGFSFGDFYTLTPSSKIYVIMKKAQE